MVDMEGQNNIAISEMNSNLNATEHEHNQTISVNVIDESGTQVTKLKTSDKKVSDKWKLLGHSSKELLMSEAAKMSPNGNVSFKVQNSLSVSKQNLKDEDYNEDDKWDTRSTAQLGSKQSLNSTYSALVANIDEQTESKVAEHGADDAGQNGLLGSGTADQYIKDAIPFLPLPVAILFLFFNIVFPGSGTILCGFSVFLCGKTRVQTKDNHKATTCCVNVWVGFSQMLTVTFMLVGWFWSVVWGIYMIILSVEYRKSERVHKEKQAQATAVTAFNPSIRPWTLKT